MSGMSETAAPGLGRLLLAFDGSEGALTACEASETVARGYGSEVTILCVIPPVSLFAAPLANHYYSLQQQQAKEHLEKAASLFEKEGMKVEREVVQARSSVVQAIVDYADSSRSDMIAMGTRGLGGFRKMLIGSVSIGVVAQAHCPVLVARASPVEGRAQLKRILCTIDGSESSQRAVGLAASLAKTLSAELTLLHVVHLTTVFAAGSSPMLPDPVVERMQAEGEKLVSAAVTEIEKRGVQAEQTIVEDFTSPARAIVDYAEKSGKDLVVVGARGLGGSVRPKLGSVISAVITYAGCSVLVVP